MTAKFRWLFIGIILFDLFTFIPAFAGTGQIFSPAGLPQSSTQTYTAPTPGNTPTVIFPTPPLPLSEGILQDFSGASIPLSNVNTQKSGGAASESIGSQKPPLSPTDGGSAQQSLPSTSETNTIDTFFQCNPPPNTAPNTKSSENKEVSVLGSTGKVIWHTLDNLGVPMLVGKDNDLDPSLRQSYVMPSPLSPNKSLTHISPQKIPESELEGTDIPPTNDQAPPLH